MKIALTNIINLRANYGMQGIIFPFSKLLSKNIDCNFVIPILENNSREDKEFVKNIPNLSIDYYNSRFEQTKRADIFDKALFKSLKFYYDAKESKRRDLFEIVRYCDSIIDVAGIEYIGNRHSLYRWADYANTSYPQIIAKQLKIPYLKYIKSYGPLLGSMYTNRARVKLQDLPFLLIRGKKNLKELEKDSLNSKLYSYPDVSLLLKPANKEKAIMYLSNYGIDVNKEIVGISPSGVIGNIKVDNKKNICGNNYLFLCQKIIKYFQKMKKQVVIIPHSIEPGYKTCDLDFSMKVLAGIKDKKNIFFLKEMPDEYAMARAIIGCLDFYITGRYHSVCSAIYMRVPTVVMSWHIKYIDLLSLFYDEFLSLDVRANSTEKSFLKIKEYYESREWSDINMLLQLKDVERQLEESAKKVATFLKCHTEANR